MMQYRHQIHCVFSSCSAQVIDDKEKCNAKNHLDVFLDEHLFSVSQSIPWYADIVKFLVIKRYPETFTCAKKDKLRTMQNTMCVMSLICGNNVPIKLL
uniref:Uncharacterized protein n=1 Tax=Lactuca sativa TaxID=4236 RepID=A0A9R1W1U1_LACSA|nr:hypothetical protein LSAT_V11C300149200 [Lactuca sativa]